MIINKRNVNVEILMNIFVKIAIKIYVINVRIIVFIQKIIKNSKG